MSTHTLDAYSELLLAHRPVVPANEREHARMVAVLESMELGARKLSSAEQRVADLIAAAVLTYEDRVCPPLEMTPHELLTRLMANRRMTQTDLAEFLGISRANAGGLCRGSHKISSNTAKRLAELFSVSVSEFLP